MSAQRPQMKPCLFLLFRYLRPLWLRNGAGILALFINSYLLIWVPVFVKQTINGLETGFSQRELFYNCLDD